MAYFVEWVGYGSEHDSWVREEDAENAADMLAEYWRRQKRPAKSILSISSRGLSNNALQSLDLHTGEPFSPLSATTIYGHRE